MRKTHYRDYATEGFRFLAREGGAAAYRNRVYNEALEAARRQESNAMCGLSAPTEAAVIRAEQALYNAEAGIKDLEAAEWAIEALERMRGRHAAEAVRMVYMAEAGRPIARGDIQDRVIQASMAIPAAEKTVYRWLGLARDLFAEKRGLRMET